MEDRQRVDCSAASYLALCTCGWRELRLTRADAWAANMAHGMAVHSGQVSRTAYRYAAKAREGGDSG